MNTKLTLKLNNRVISRAKKYAEEKEISLSKLIESYLNHLTEPEKEKSNITPLVKSISGIVQLPENYDRKKNYKEYLSKKYSKQK